MITKTLRRLPEVYPIEHVRIVDGDTLEADILLPFDQKVRKKIRLRGWWADELHGPYHSQAQIACVKLYNWCHGKALWLHAPSCRVDRYGRVLGHIIQHGKIVTPQEVLGDNQLTEAEHKMRSDQTNRGQGKAWQPPCGGVHGTSVTTAAHPPCAPQSDWSLIDGAEFAGG